MGFPLLFNRRLHAMQHAVAAWQGLAMAKHEIEDVGPSGKPMQPTKSGLEKNLRLWVKMGIIMG